MTNIVTPTQPSLSSAPATLRFDWLMTILSLWLVSGLHLDAWAHHQFEVETYFNTWHAVLYSGFAAIAIALVGSVLWNYRQTPVWQAAVPAGYQLALLGIALFMVGGIGDMVWHLLFGIEDNLEALLSPTHLLLGLGGGLIVTAPLRAAWHQTKTAPTLTSLLPALISSALTLALFSFFTAYAHPLAETAVSGTPPLTIEQQGFLQAQGIAKSACHLAHLTMKFCVSLAFFPKPVNYSKPTPVRNPTSGIATSETKYIYNYISRKF